MPQTLKLSPIFFQERWYVLKQKLHNYFCGLNNYFNKNGRSWKLYGLNSALLFIHTVCFVLFCFVLIVLLYIIYKQNDYLVKKKTQKLKNGNDIEAGPADCELLIKIFELQFLIIFKWLKT